MNEHYLIVKGTVAPDGALHHHTDPEAAYVVMNGATVWDDYVKDFVRPDGSAELHQHELYEKLTAKITIIDRITKTLLDSLELDDDRSDGEVLDDIFDLFAEAELPITGGNS